MLVDHLPKEPGVYKITCTANGRFYIGSSINILIRLKEHRNSLVKNKHHSRHIQRCCKKYGIESFVVEVLELCSTDVLLIREQYYMDTLKPKLNSSPTAGSPLGVKHTDETKAKISAALKGRKVSAATVARLIEYNKTRVLSPESRRKFSDVQKGKKLSDETKAKISEANKGKFVSEETRAKIAESNRRRTVSEETRLKMSESIKQTWERKRQEKEKPP